MGKDEAGKSQKGKRKKEEKVKKRRRRSEFQFLLEGLYEEMVREAKNDAGTFSMRSCVRVCSRILQLIRAAVPLVDPQRSHFCEQLGGERLTKKREEMRGERRRRRVDLLKTMPRIIERTGPGLAPGSVDECVRLVCAS